MTGFPDLPPIWLLGFCGLAWLLGMGLPLWQPDGFPAHLIGAAVAVAGIVLIAWSALWFARKKTTIEPHEPPTKLIVEGPYRLSRNPIYLGMVVILAGVVIWQGAVSGAVLLPVFIGLLSRRFIRPEEARLREIFGPEGEAYLQQTRRWL